MNRKQNHSLPPEIEEYRDLHWRREETLRVETAPQAEAFIERVGFTACMTDSRQPGPSLYIAVCGRRDAVMPHNVQKDPESSHTWILKDEIIRRSRVYYGKLARGKTMFIAPRMIPQFNAIWGVAKREEKRRLSAEALAILKVLRKEWERSQSLHTGDRRIAGGDDRRAERCRLSTQVQLHLDARRRTLSRTTGAQDRSPKRAARDRAMLSGLRRHDLSGRASQGYRAFASRSRHRKSGSGQREDNDLAFDRVIYQIESGASIRSGN
jgi:hypothetical protein